MVPQYRLEDMTNEQIMALSDNCWDNCKSMNMACVVRRYLNIPSLSTRMTGKC